MSDPSAVAVCIVTHNSGADIAECLEAVAASTHRPLTVKVVDCASRDDSLAIAERHAPADLDLELIPLQSNLGFAGGMNVAIGRCDAPYVVTLNPDARPTREFIARLVDCVEAHPEQPIGAVTGRLLRPGDRDSRQIDACGMYLTWTWRHLDRGSGLVDRSQWMKREEVFGATGAAALFTRAALIDTAIEGDFFASEFHSYREDAELCFRLRERGWTVIYEPRARCEHRRTNVPERRQAMAPEINYHSLKNRYLLRAYHQHPANLVLTLIPTLWRDLLALTYVLLAERTSLRAYSWLWKHRRLIRQRRRSIAARRTCGARAVDRWFFRRSLPP